MKPILTLLEGKWYANKHVSTRDLFVPLFSIWTANPIDVCHHEQFTTTAAFRAAIRYAFQKNRASTIYVGAHGSRAQIHGFHDERIARTVIRNAIADSPPGTRRGIFFGACDFVTPVNAAFLLSGCPRLAWVAGYETSINWTDSSILDLYFFRHYLFPTPGKGNRRPRTIMDKVQHAAEKVGADMAPLAKKLKFNVYTRERGGATPLLDYSS